MLFPAKYNSLSIFFKDPLPQQAAGVTTQTSDICHLLSIIHQPSCPQSFLSSVIRLQMLDIRHPTSYIRLITSYYQASDVRLSDIRQQVEGFRQLYRSGREEGGYGRRQ